MDAVNKLTEATVKSFGSFLFKVTFLVEEQNEQMVKCFIEHLFETYKKTYPEALVTIAPNIVIEQETFPSREKD